MADVDLIREAYRNNLGRDASDEEVNNWTGGNYGGGGVNDWLNQIQNSGEAQSYRGAQEPVIQPQPETYHGYDNQPSQPSYDPSAWNQVSDYYTSFLGRQGSQDEINNWLSGAYGWGNSGNLQGIQRGIMGSAEARAFRPADVSSDGSGDQAYQDALNGLTNVYKQFLGRAPGAGEAEKWLSGGYGYGSGAGDYNKYVNAIMGSDEARRYRGNGTTEPNGYHGIDYWQSQGVPAIDIFDPNTGQLKSGWQRTATGYERIGGTGTGTGTSTSGIPGGNAQAYIKSLLTGNASPQALAALEPMLNKYGIKLQKDSDGNIRGRLFLPDGTAVDVVGPGGWGGAWQWLDRGKNSGDGVGGVAGPKNQYSDPYTQFLEMLLKQRIGNLQQPVNDPYMAMYQAQLKQRADALAQNTPQLNSLIEYLNSRFKDLQGPGYTGAENEALRTGALDPIETDRAAARKTVLARLAQRGINPDSGVAQAALLEVDKQFDALRGTAQTTLTTNDLQRREGRQQRAEQIQSTLAQIPEGRARESLDIYSTLNQLSSMARQEDDARQREAIGYGGALSDLGPQRLQLAMQAANLGGNPSSMFQNLMQLAGLNQNSAAYNAQNNSSLWSGLGSLAAVLANAGR